MRDLYLTYRLEKPDWSVSALCRALDVARSSYHYKSERRDESALRQAISETAGAWPKYGSERITAQLRRDGVTFEGKPVGERRVRRLMREMKLLAKPHRKKIRTTDSEHNLPRYPNLVKELEVTAAEQVWVSDITYIALGSGFVYLAVILDIFTRSIRGWHLSRRLDTDLTLTALRKALGRHKAPTIHHSDQGCQYASGEYVAHLTHYGVKVSMAAVGTPEENGFAERLMRTLKEEHVGLSEYRNFRDAYAQIGTFIDEVYQYKRIHSALGYLTPAEAEAKYTKEQENISTE